MGSDERQSRSRSVRRRSLTPGALIALVLTGPAVASVQQGYLPTAAADWRRFDSLTDPEFVRLWTWGASGGRNPPPVTSLVALVPDQTFGTVARIQQGPGTALSPQLMAKLHPPLANAWVRFRVRFSPGWTASGSQGPSHGSAYKVAHLYFAGFGSEARTRLDLENRSEWGCSFYVPGRTFTRAPVPGDQGGGQGCGWTTNFGDALSDGQWLEWIVHHETLSATSGRVRWWQRRITGPGAPTAWRLAGRTYTGATSNDSFPAVRNLRLGVNRNRVADAMQYVYWGPWEIVDGSRYADPFGVLP